MTALPDDIPQTVEELEEVLSRPSDQAVQALARVEGDIMLLGAGGKMGPTLARMAIRAVEAAGTRRRVFAVSRFSDSELCTRLREWGVETIVCDLLDERAVAELPRVPNVIFMTGMKFGASRNPSLTWAMNCYAPALICRRFRDSRVVAFSSGNVYAMAPADSQGSCESDIPAPWGEYSMTVLGRERMFDYFSRELSIPLVLLRLNYATELRYGVLVDIGCDVLAGRPVDVSTPRFNVIWQAEANAMTLAALEHVATPPEVINVAGPEILNVREVARQFGALMDKPVQFIGDEADTAYLSDGRKGHGMLGEVSVRAEQMIRWTADWLLHGGPTLGKPTHFQVRDGKF
jgi:hypothetical protein